MNIQKKIKKKLYNIDYRLDGGSGAGVTINPIAFLVIQQNNVKLIPVNHTSSLDKLLDYVPDLIEKTNNMFNSCMQSRKEETERILKEMQNKHNKSMKKEEEDRKSIERKIEKEVEKVNRVSSSSDETYEFEYDETMEDE